MAMKAAVDCAFVLTVAMKAATSFLFQHFRRVYGIGKDVAHVRFRHGRDAFMEGAYAVVSGDVCCVGRGRSIFRSERRQRVGNQRALWDEADPVAQCDAAAHAEKDAGGVGTEPVARALDVSHMRALAGATPKRDHQPGSAPAHIGEPPGALGCLGACAAATAFRNVLVKQIENNVVHVVIAWDDAVHPTAADVGSES